MARGEEDVWKWDYEFLSVVWDNACDELECESGRSVVGSVGVDGCGYCCVDDHGYGLWLVVFLHCWSVDLVAKRNIGAVFMYVTSSAPTKSSLGAVNGISQTVVSMTRAIGPAMATALFSFCAEKQLLGGYAVYVVFGLMTVGGLVVADMLPEEAWDAAQSREEEDDD